MGREWSQAAAARNAFADLIESLDQEQFDRPSWCEGWSVHAVVAHVAYLSACTPVPR